MANYLEKTGAITIGRMFGRQTKLHEVECLRSSYAKKPGPIPLVPSSHMSGRNCGCWISNSFR
jgi:hypothetical protein